MNTRKYLAGVLILLFAFSSCKNKTTDQAPHEETKDHAESQDPGTITEFKITSRQYKAAGIVLGHLKNANLTSSIRTSGTLDVPPQNYAEVSAYIGGIIKSIHVIEGDHVKAGQVVMMLEHPDYVKLQEEFISVQNEFKFLQQEYLRQKELFEQKVSSGKAYQEAESKYNASKGRLSSLRSQLEMLNINIQELEKGNISKTIVLRSPLNGYIAHVHGSLGSFAEPNKMLFDVIDNSHIHVHLDVFEKDFYKIKIGQKITVTLPNQAQELEGEIFNIGKAMDEATKSISVHAEIRNDKGLELIPGVFVNALIHVGTQQVMAAPVEAVVRSGEKQYVFVVNTESCRKAPVKGEDPCMVIDGSGDTIMLAYKTIEVKTGTEEMGLVELFPLKEITMNDEVVVKGAYFLISALKSGETVGCCAPEN